VHDPATVAAGSSASNPTAPAGTSPFTPWIWVFAFTPLLGLTTLLFPQDVGYGSFSSSSATSMQELRDIYASTFTPSYFAALGVSFLFYGLGVLIALLDWRELKSRGVEKPFHWAFAFIPWQLTYAIGRAVVVTRRTGSGWSPMVVYIAIGVLYFMTSVVIGMVQAVQSLGPLS
jgi:hypothetical protein